MHPETKKAVAPVELCPILKTLYKILIKRLETCTGALRLIESLLG
jgi:glycerol-3-phosphate dehydrogenase (NAD+)